MRSQERYFNEDVTGAKTLCLHIVFCEAQEIRVVVRRPCLPKSGPPDGRLWVSMPVSCRWVQRTSLANPEEPARAHLAVQVHARTIPVIIKVATLDGIEGEVGIE